MICSTLIFFYNRQMNLRIHLRELACSGNVCRGGPRRKIRSQVLRSCIHPDIGDFPDCFVRDNPSQATLPLNYSRERIRLLWRESTPLFRGSSCVEAKTVEGLSGWSGPSRFSGLCQFIWCDEQERRNRQDRPDRHPQLPAGKARSGGSGGSLF